MSGPYSEAVRPRMRGEAVAKGSTISTVNSPGWATPRWWLTAVAAARCPPPVSAIRKRSERDTAPEPSEAGGRKVAAGGDQPPKETVRASIPGGSPVRRRGPEPSALAITASSAPDGMVVM